MSTATDAPLTLTVGGHLPDVWEHHQVVSREPLSVAALDRLGADGWCLAAVVGRTWVFRRRPVVVARPVE
jgi:hypothetical protein